MFIKINLPKTLVMELLNALPIAGFLLAGMGLLLVVSQCDQTAG